MASGHAGKRGAFRIMGVDPGTVAAGYAVLENELRPTAVSRGTIKSPKSASIEKRLKTLRDGLSEVTEEHRPDVIAIENPFVGRNPNTSLAVGQAQAATFIAAADNGVPVATYPPATVKYHAAGDGRASKDQVNRLVSAVLEIPSPESSDEADALAVALCHINAMAGQRAMDRELAGTGKHAPKQRRGKADAKR